MNTDAQAFLRIEKLTKGKIEGFEEWEEIPLSTDAVLIASSSKKVDSIPPDIKILGDDAKAFARGKHGAPSLRVSSRIFYDPYDLPKWFYWGYHNLDLYSLYSPLVSREVISEGEYQRGTLPQLWEIVSRV
ncbi:MAG: hypothetical protein MIO92_03125 [Methanosarcinaceae archaeon]|nr:hypothetical protein [Methanosarcinaceae archaeon]